MTPDRNLVESPPTSRVVSGSLPDAPSTPTFTFELICVVWGTRYANTLTNLTLPALLAPSNLPSLFASHRIHVVIYTDPETAPLIHSCWSVEALYDIAQTVEIREIERTDAISGPIAQTYSFLCRCHQLAIQASRPDAVLLFINADTIYAAGAMARLPSILRAGYRTVELVTPRGLLEAIAPKLHALAGPQRTIDVASRPLLRLVFEHPHPITRAHFFANDDSLLVPDNLYWSLVDKGIVAKCTHFHPLLVFPRIRDGRFYGTIDHDFVQNSGIRRNERYYVCDSNEICAIELSARTHTQDFPIYTPGSTRSLGRYFRDMCTIDNLKNLEHSVKIDCSEKDIPLSAWVNTERTAQNIISDALSHVDLPYSRFSIIIPIWGNKYVNKFCSYGLASLFSPGNIPLLDRQGGIQLVFLTSRASKDIIERHVHRIMDDISVKLKFIFIDDLLTLQPNYGLILTLSFARGIQATMACQVGVAFILVNADFVFSENWGEYILDILSQGKRAIAVPTIRVSEAQFTWVIDELRAEKRHLSLSSQLLVQVALGRLHPTVLASIVDNDGRVRHRGANQFLTHSTDGDMWGLIFLRMPLVIAPRRPLEWVTSFCDYSLVSDLVDEDDLFLPSDSSCGVVIELQDEGDESIYFSADPVPTEMSVRDLALWTSDYHRRCGLLPYRITSSDGSDPATPPLPLVELMERIQQGLGSTAVKPSESPFWRGTLRTLGLVRTLRPFAYARIGKASTTMFKAVLGRPTAARNIHPLRRDLQAVRQYFETLQQRPGRVLYLTRSPTVVDDFVIQRKSYGVDIDVVSTRAIHLGCVPAPRPQWDEVVAACDYSEMGAMFSDIRNCVSKLAEARRITIIVTGRHLPWGVLQSELVKETLAFSHLGLKAVDTILVRRSKKEMTRWKRISNRLHRLHGAAKMVDARPLSWFRLLKALGIFGGALVVSSPVLEKILESARYVSRRERENEEDGVDELVASSLAYRQEEEWVSTAIVTFCWKRES